MRIGRLFSCCFSAGHEGITPVNHPLWFPFRKTPSGSFPTPWAIPYSAPAFASLALRDVDVLPFNAVLGLGELACDTVLCVCRYAYLSIPRVPTSPVPLNSSNMFIYSTAIGQMES